MSMGWIKTLIMSGLMLLCGCSMMALKEDLQTAVKSGLALVQISNRDVNASVILYLYKKSNEDVVLMEQRVSANHLPLIFINPPDEYQLFIFEDRSNDGVWQLNESYAVASPIWNNIVLRDSEKKAPTAEDYAPTDIRLAPVINPRQNEIAALAAALERQNARLPNRFLQESTLADAKFSPDSIQLGAWQPLTFMNTIGYGFYLLEPLNPQKIPVLFVHGINDSPTTFSKTIEALDKERFQAVFYHYPGSMALEYSAYQLAQFVSRFCIAQRSLVLPMVSHSMGGLVTRRMQQMLDNAPCKISIPWWLSISTPFAGHEGARWGVETSPVIAPVWFDMTPGSAFLKNLEQPPERNIPHHMVVSYGGAGRLAGASNDGVVTVESELADYVYDRALSLTMVNENHMDVLSAKRTLAKLQELQLIP